MEIHNDMNDTTPEPPTMPATTGTTVSIEIPATNRHVALVRTTAVGVIADLDPDLDLVENLRLAVNEIVSMVVESARGGSVRVEFDLHGRALGVTASASEPGEPVVLDELARRILDTTSSHYEMHDDGSVRLRIDLAGDAEGG